MTGDECGGKACIADEGIWKEGDVWMVELRGVGALANRHGAGRVLRYSSDTPVLLGGYKGEMNASVVAA